jgi:hypothetical protein
LATARLLLLSWSAPFYSRECRLEANADVLDLQIVANAEQAGSIYYGQDGDGVTGIEGTTFAL